VVDAANRAALPDRARPAAPPARPPWGIVRSRRRHGVTHARSLDFRPRQRPRRRPFDRPERLRTRLRRHPRSEPRPPLRRDVKGLRRRGLCQVL